MGAPEHTLDNYKALKSKVQELIDSKAISFTPNSPNIKNNPMPAHVGMSISVVEQSDSQELVTVVEKIQTPMLVVREQLLRHSLIPTNHVSCKDCISNPEICEKLKGCVQ